MRLDKFLKISRLIKRRPVANELCKGGHVHINGKPAKAATEVKPGDEMAIRMGHRLITVRCEQTPEKAVSVQEAPGLYTTLSEATVDTRL